VEEGRHSAHHCLKKKKKKDKNGYDEYNGGIFVSEIYQSRSPGGSIAAM
jgi:hypothetical protein